MFPAWRILMAMMATAAAAGCDRSSPPSAPPSPAAPAANVALKIDPVSLGEIRGQVVLDGPAPKMGLAGHGYFANQVFDIPDESCMVDGLGGLKNVVVYLKDPPVSPPTAMEPVTLDQIKCVYTPHVVALRVGQPLRIRNSDPMLHNVHFMSEKNESAPIFLQPGDARDVTFTAPEFVPARCDVHVGMSAWVAVLDHPYFCVTAADGGFVIPNVPAGKYTLVAWQEKLPSEEQPVAVAAGAVSDCRIVFESPWKN
jgi:plastocyanin